MFEDNIPLIVQSMESANVRCPANDARYYLYHGCNTATHRIRHGKSILNLTKTFHHTHTTAACINIGRLQDIVIDMSRPVPSHKGTEIVENLPRR